jgi:hypothetical protein
MIFLYILVTLIACLILLTYLSIYSEYLDVYDNKYYELTSCGGYIKEYGDFFICVYPPCEDHVIVEMKIMKSVFDLKRPTMFVASGITRRSAMLNILEQMRQHNINVEKIERRLEHG